MSSLALPARRPVLADALAGQRTLARDVALVLAGALVVAVLAQVTIPMPFVPITGQTLGVLLVGAALGARRGAAALTAYMMVGLAGLPVFAGFAGGPGAVLLPSFGFILGFIPAAFVAGWFAERRWDRGMLRALAGFALASAIPFLLGVPYMAMILNAVMGLGLGAGDVIAAGVVPFIPGGIVKAVLAAALIPLAWKGVGALERRR
ncbi:MAG: biotin transporter BioY [Brachybacterium sp.]|nr:biotin transporter BioY [Brachybacterium sp.]